MSLAQTFSAWIAHYGGIAYFPLMYVNGVGMPLIPAESLLFVGSVLAEKGKISFVAMIIAAFCGSVLGSMTGYFIGRWGGQTLVARIVKFFRMNPEKFAKFENKLRTKGIYFIIIARFIPIARELNGLIGGSIGMSFGRYMTGNLIGALLWILCWGILPYVFGHIL